MEVVPETSQNSRVPLIPTPDFAEGFSHVISGAGNIRNPKCPFPRGTPQANRVLLRERSCSEGKWVGRKTPL